MRCAVFMFISLLFSSLTYAEQCDKISKSLQGAWNWEVRGEQHSIEFLGSGNAALIDGKSKEIYLCSSYTSSVFKYVTYRFSTKQDWNSYSIKLQEEDNFLGSAGAEITVGFKNYSLQKNEAITNLPNTFETDLVARFNTSIGFEGQLFPSMIIATAFNSKNPSIWATNQEKQNKILGDESGPVSVLIRNEEANTFIRIEVSLGKLADTSIYEGTLLDAGSVYDIRPKINFDFDYLLSIKQPIPLNSKIVIFINGEKVDEKIYTINVRSINDAPFAVINRDAQKYLDTSWIFAAYVNENHPWIDQLLREALNTGSITSFTGYLTEQPNDVHSQVFAIWNALQRRGFQYSTITTPTGYSEKVFSQYVRFFSDSILNSQANCIDGTVLFASILRRIGIDPIIVLIPGHAYLGFYLDKNKQNAAYLETTVIGHTNLRQFVPDGTITGDLSRLMGLPTQNKASLNAYITALKMGAGHTGKAGSRFNSQNFPSYKKIDVSEARKIGILPINH